VLVFSVPYARGWSLRLDGQPVPAHRVSVGLLGAAIGPGRHAVALRYWPPGFLPGAAVSLAAAAAAGALAGRGVLRRRRGAGEPLAAAKPARVLPAPGRRDV
jgi:hypothetical protein